LRVSVRGRFFGTFNKSGKFFKTKSLKTFFEKDPNSPDKVFFKYCKKTYKPRACDLEEHLATNKHKITSEKGYQKNISEFTLGKSIARSEIIWAYLTVFRNLSFNFSDYASDYFRKMFPDSKIAEKQTINRKKIKLIMKTFY